MRSVERVLSGGLPLSNGLFRTTEISGPEVGSKAVTVARLVNETIAKIDLTRSGVAALGEYESGHPSHSGACRIALMLLESLTLAGGWTANVSRSQIDTQAANAHRKENGSTAAMSRLGSNRVILKSSPYSPLYSPLCQSLRS